jgi:Uma2 family endonuclease
MTPVVGVPVSGDALLTAEQYQQFPDPGVPTELVRGRVVEMSRPTLRHGQICSKIDRIVGNYVEERQLGHAVSNDAGILTERGPDTVRGADVAFYSYARVPRGPLPNSYGDVVPELTFEVRSLNDKWPKVLAKVSEYLNAGVTVVCVLDPKSETILVYRSEELPLTLEGDDELHLPDVLGDFRVPVRRFFE